ncbi:hypothetical protein CHCC14821_4315 [Bacillus paralicheniformis]|nr:hypothetical protein CHCC14821_4315 [Bacillus paralicheniformis]
MVINRRALKKQRHLIKHTFYTPTMAFEVVSEYLIRGQSFFVKQNGTNLLF